MWELLDLLMANFGAELSTRMPLAHYFQSCYHRLCIYCSSSPLFLPAHNTTLLSGTRIKTATFRMVIIFSKGNPVILINMMSMWCYSWVFITEFYLQFFNLKCVLLILQSNAVQSLFPICWNFCSHCFCYGLKVKYLVWAFCRLKLCLTDKSHSVKNEHWGLKLDGVKVL